MDEHDCAEVINHFYKFIKVIKTGFSTKNSEVVNSHALSWCVFTVSHFHPSLVFVSKVRVPPLEWCSIRDVSCSQILG